MQTDFLERELPKCEFSPCARYRYTLWRRTGIAGNWYPLECEHGYDACPDCDRDASFSGRAGQYVNFICLNPSTADNAKNDPTITRCVDFARRWGFGGFCMTNLFAWRDKSPMDMKAAPDPVGALNNEWLVEIARRAGIVICAWGEHGAHLSRATIVRGVLKEHVREKLHALRVTKGEPWHPLYLPAATVPFPI